MRVLSLFSGGGLGDYGLTLAGMEIVGQVEIDEYCQKILKLRWPDVPKWRDIRDVKGSEVLEKCGRIDLISGGFPCQDISIAGKHEGIGGARSGLWSEQVRIIGELRPRKVLVENVAEILKRGLGRVLADLTALGYDTEWITLPSWFFGSPHNRERVWIISYPKNNGCQHSCDDKGEQNPERPILAQVPIKGGVSFAKKRFYEEVRSAEFVRKANGTSNRMDRIRMCGNGQQVQVVEWIGKRIMEYEAEGNQR